MSVVAPQNWQQLIEQLPEVPADAELILRSGKLGPTATIRYADVAPRVFVRNEHGVREQIPAFDQGLQGASLLAGDVALAEALTPIVGPIRSAELVSWRPGRRAVLRLDLENGESQWLKLLDRKSYRRAKRAFAALGSSLAPLKMMVPYALVPKWHGYIAKAASGMPLRAAIKANDEICWGGLTRALLAIGYTELQGGDDGKDAVDGLPTIDFGHAQAAAVNMLQKGAALQRELAELADRVAQLPQPALVAKAVVHGDLHDKQLFIDSGNVSLIDLEGIGLGDTRFDLVNLAEHIRLRDLQQQQRDSGLADCVIARCCLDSNDPEVRAFRAVIRARLVGVYALRPRWRELVTQLRGEVAELVGELA